VVDQTTRRWSKNGFSDVKFSTRCPRCDSDRVLSALKWCQSQVWSLIPRLEPSTDGSAALTSQHIPPNSEPAAAGRKKASPPVFGSHPAAYQRARRLNLPRQSDDGIVCAFALRTLDRNGIAWDLRYPSLTPSSCVTTCTRHCDHEYFSGGI